MRENSNIVNLWKRRRKVYIFLSEIDSPLQKDSTFFLEEGIVFRNWLIIYLLIILSAESNRLNFGFAPFVSSSIFIVTFLESFMFCVFAAKTCFDIFDSDSFLAVRSLTLSL